MRGQTRRAWILRITACVAALAVLALGAKALSGILEPPRWTVTAMYIPLGRGDPPTSYILFDQEDDSAFRLAPFPDGVTGIDGKIMSKDQLKKGNILEISLSNNTVEQLTYPGTICGDSRIKVIQEGKPEDADQYQAAVAQIYDPHPETPPTLFISYEEVFLESSVYCGSQVSPESYEWHYEDLEGNAALASAEKPHVLQRTDLTDLDIKEPVPLELSVYGDSPTWSVLRWKETLLGTEGDSAGEEVSLTENERGEMVIQDAEPGWVYQVTVRWDQSWVAYGFLT